MAENLYRKYAKAFGLPDEDISHADYDMLNETLSITYGINRVRKDQKTLRRKATKEFADFFKAPIFVAKSPEYILDAYLKEKEKIPVFGLPQDTKKVIEEFGKPIQTEPEKEKPIEYIKVYRIYYESKLGKKDIQGATEDDLGLVLSGLRAGGYLITKVIDIDTKRDIDWLPIFLKYQKEKPIIPQQPVKSMVSEELKKKLELAKAKTESPLGTFPVSQLPPTPLPPSPPGTHGTEYELLYNLVTSDGMDELYEARRELRDIILHDTARKQLTDSDIAYLQKMIDAKEKEYQEKYPVGEEKEIFRKVEPLKRPEKQIMGAREIIAKREKEEEKEDDVHGYKITRPTIDIKRLNFGEAHDFLLAYNKYLPEILRIGLREWFIQHPQAQRFPLHQTNYDQLFQVLSMYISPYPPKNIKELIAYRILKDTIGVAVEFGMTLALSQIDWETYYQQAKTQSKQTPDLTTFKKDIMMTLNGILQEVRVT